MGGLAGWRACCELDIMNSYLVWCENFRGFPPGVVYGRPGAIEGGIKGRKEGRGGGKSKG